MNRAAADFGLQRRIVEVQGLKTTNSGLGRERGRRPRHSKANGIPAALNEEWTTSSAMQVHKGNDFHSVDLSFWEQTPPPEARQSLTSRALIAAFREMFSRRSWGIHSVSITIHRHRKISLWFCEISQDWSHPKYVSDPRNPVTMPVLNNIGLHIFVISIGHFFCKSPSAWTICTRFPVQSGLDLIAGSDLSQCTLYYYQSTNFR